MRQNAYVFGIVLIVLAVVFFLATGAQSPTALIPALFGGALCVCAYLAAQDSYRQHAMHAAAFIGLVGMVASAPGLYQLIPLAFGSEVERPAAVAEQAIMCALSIIYVLLSVKAFRDARKAATS